MTKQIHKSSSCAQHVNPEEFPELKVDREFVVDLYLCHYSINMHIHQEYV